ncbi:Alpha/Beta hydrolase protein [Phaeosphaeriaceae sp. PMI808]|nr:Alpha/Beta hydrolase protein [Phaeosphaeriaceae sp. PMI808]
MERLTDRSYVRNSSPQEMQSATEAKLCDVVAQCFGASDLDIHKDLFTRILDSLSSMRYASSLRDALDVPVRLRWILETRTIHLLAKRIDVYNANISENHTAGADTYDTQMQSSIQLCSQNPFCIHPVSSLANVFHGLTTNLPHFNVIGINDNFFGEDDAYKSVEAMAEQYVIVIQQYQSQGSFMLLGYSFGAHIAVEISRILRAQSYIVRLILVDSSVRDEDCDKFKLPHMVEFIIQSCQLGAVKSQESTDEQNFVKGLREEVVHNLRLLTSYKMNYLAGPVTFLKAYQQSSNGDSNRNQISNGYDKLVEEVRVDFVQGDHSELFYANNITYNSNVIRRALED